MKSNKNLIIGCLSLMVLNGCANTQQPVQDPLQHTKQLIKKGHGDLYDNGAFHVPNTKISLIPPGPTAMEFAKDLAGIRAKQSFEKSLKNARDAVYLVADGTRKSFKVASTVHDNTHEIAQYITQYSRDNSQLLIYRAYPHTKEIIGEAWQSAERIEYKLNTAADNTIRNTEKVRQSMDKVAAYADGSFTRSLDTAKELSSTTNHLAKEGFNYALSEFIQGYAALPQSLASRMDKITNHSSLNDFSNNYQASLAYREKRSDFYSDVVINATDHYQEEVTGSFNKATSAFDNVDETGFSLAVLQATRWVLQGMFWDGLIKPVGKLAVGSVGYLTVNTVTFPVMLVASQTAPVAEVAVAISWNTAAMAYDVIAPTAIAATASLFSVAGMAAGQSIAGITVAGGTALEGSRYLVKGAALIVEGSGKVAGHSITYIAVPLSTAGIKLAGSAAGVVIGSADAVAGSALFVAGETAAATTQVVGNLTAGTTLVAGTTTSAIVGVGLGVYELSKAVVVPTSYALGGGIVLGYGSTSQIAAHSILAVSDAAYLVLSLEGPRWVLYAVKGTLDSGEQLIPGTLLNLEKMQDAGETFYQLPISEENMHQLLEAIPEDLPRNQSH